MRDSSFERSTHVHDDSGHHRFAFFPPAAGPGRHRPDRLTTLALGGIVAGAIGNGWDRAFREAPGGGTGVVDFIAVTLPGGYRWPTFNVADVLLAVGVGLILVASLRKAAPAELEPTPS